MNDDASFLPRRRVDPEVAGLISWWQTLHCATPSHGRPSALRDGERVQRLLAAITLGHVVQAFVAFRCEHFVGKASDPRFRLLTRAQFAALEQLGMVAAEGRGPGRELQRKITRIVGDLATVRAFATPNFWGSPVASAPSSSDAASLNLRSRQLLAADSVFFGLHEQIARRRGATHVEILGLLEDDQVTAFARLAERMPGDAASSKPRGPVPLFDILVEELNLAGKQQADLAVSCALLRHDVKKFHELARGQFLRLLDAGQRGLLDRLEASPP